MDGGRALVTETFSPETDLRAFRHALGAFATGVTVITTVTDTGPVGITANSFASVSLDPPLVLWSPAKASSRFGIFSVAERFAVHVLRTDQKSVADGFTRSWTAFHDLDWAADGFGTPLIEGTLARFVCQTEARHDAGDHMIVVGRVLAVTRGVPGAPLVFHGGSYGGFGAV
ncbi:MAG: flavin reductase family protein [Rhodobacterales bacterium]|nr:flavin reductase family protein [Rhodobacterales bacterium]